MSDEYADYRGVGSPFQTWEGLPSSGPTSPVTGLGQEQVSSSEPLRQEHRRTASSVSTREPAVTHWAPHGVGGDLETLQHLPRRPTLQDPLCSPPC